MNERPEPREEPDMGSGIGASHDGNAISPLPGEPGIPNVAQRSRSPMSKKGLLAVGLLILSLVAVSAFSIQRFASSGKKVDDGESKRVGDRPTAARDQSTRNLPVPETFRTAPKIVKRAI